MTPKSKQNKPNQLISVIPKEKLNLIQQKSYNVLLKLSQEHLMSKDNYVEEINKDTRYSFTIRCNDLEKKAGLGQQDYNYLEQSLKELCTILVEVKDQEKENTRDAFTLLERISRKGNKFEFSLDWMLIKMLKENTYFTNLNLAEIAKLKSKYSVILYEMVKRYYSNNNPNVEIPQMSIKELREITNTEKIYDKFYALRRRVLDRACNEISEKTDMILDYKTEKPGRKITHIQFNAHKKRKHENIEKKQKDYTQNVLELYKLLPQKEQIESNKETLAELLKNYEYRYIQYSIKYAKKFNLKNFMLFIVDSCKNGHFDKAMLEKEKELAKKKRKEELKKKKAKKERQKLMEEIVTTKCENLAEEKKEKVKQRYYYLREVDRSEIDFEDRPAKMFAENHSFEEYLVKYFKSKLEV